MYINNKQKIQENQKEINDNKKNENLNGKLKIYGKKTLIKPNQNLALLPKLEHQENKINLLKNEKIIKKPFIRSSSDVMIKKYNINAKEKEKEDFKEELLIIQNLWEELGVTKIYQEQFNHFLTNENIRKIMLSQEKENLQKLRNSLMKLRKEILIRENNIDSLIKIIRVLETQNMKDNLLKEVITIIKSLRLNAINIVFYMTKIRELAFYYYFQGKWDLTKIKKDYLYNNSYLLKMKDDLNFIVNSILKNYIEMSNSPIDPFLTNCSQRNNKNNNQDKIIIPITDELSKLIGQCMFIMIQDQLLDNIYNNNLNTHYNNRENSGKIKLRKFSARSPGKSHGIFNNMYNKDLSNSLKYSQNNPFINLSKTINIIKNDNPSQYNNLFFSNQTPNLKSNNNLKETRKIFEQRKKMRSPNRNRYNMNNYIQNFDSPKRIIVEHEILNSKSKNFYNNPNKYESIEIHFNSDSKDITEKKVYQSNKDNANNNNMNIEKEKMNNIINENEKLKKYNEEIKNELLNSKKSMEQNDKIRKNLENKLKIQKEEMNKVSNSVEEIKQQLMMEKKELEQKLNEEIEKNKEAKTINKEREEKIKKQTIINQEIEFEIIKKNDEQIERCQNKSIKEENDYINNNKNEDNHIINDNNILNNSENDNDNEIKEEFDKKDNNNNYNNNDNLYNITNSEKKDTKQNIENNNDFKNNEINNENNEQNYKMNKSLNNIEENENFEDESEDEINKNNEKEIITDKDINIKENDISNNNKYKVEYYKGNISTFINELKNDMPLEKIDEEIKIIFELEKKIYNKESYLIGQYPQIIVCKSYESHIIGFCSFYYQNILKNENILKINFMCAIKDNNDDNFDNKSNLFDKFIIMIDFIKNNSEYDELFITLNYNKIILDNENQQFKINEEILNFFKKEMGFIWVCVENIKGLTQKQQLCYKNKNKDNNNNNEINSFLDSETISFLSFIQKDCNLSTKYNYNNYKFINNLPIYAILTGQKDLLLVDFKDNNYRFDSSKVKSKQNPIITKCSPENKTIEDLESNIELNEDKDNINNIIKDSLFFEYYNKYKVNQMVYSFGLFKMNLNIFFKNILITQIDNYYYNKIYYDIIEIINDKENNCILYHLSCLNKINDIVIFEISNKIKKSFIDNNKNLNELFINYFNKIQEEKNDKQIIKNINIFIPCFNIEAHLQTEKVSKTINNIDIKKSNNDERQNIPMKIGTFDEFLKINFNKNIPIENQINYDINQDFINDNENDIIIKNDFILCILNNYKDIKLPLYQLIYVVKEYWIKVETKSESE